MGISVLASERVSLRALREDDTGAIEAWYGEAARTAYEERSLEELLAKAEQGDGLFAISRSEGDEPIGVVEYQREDEWLGVSFIALARTYRGWGYGSEAVRALESEAEGAWGVRRFRAEVDVRNGLGLYFWLRLGYRPARGGDPDAFVMVRTS